MSFVESPNFLEVVYDQNDLFAFAVAVFVVVKASSPFYAVGYAVIVPSLKKKMKYKNGSRKERSRKRKSKAALLKV